MPQNTNANLTFLKKSIDKFIELGAKRGGYEFHMEIKDAAFADVSYLVFSTQIPQLSRYAIEQTGHMGLTSREQGIPETTHEITVQFQETVQGHIFEMMLSWYRKKEYKDVVLKLRGENDSTGGGNGKQFTLKRCFLRSDPQDLSVEDTTQGFRPNVTLIYSYVEEFFKSS